MSSVARITSRSMRVSIEWRYTGTSASNLIIGSAGRAVGDAVGARRCASAASARRGGDGERAAVCTRTPKLQR
jgi:hypothetical protein